MSSAVKPGGNASDTANIVVTVLGLLFILAALWLGDVVTSRDQDPAVQAEVPPPRAVVELH
jgi:hypothetical protein